MSKRLQVLLDEKDYREIGRLARQHKVSVAEWVRSALRAARREEPSVDANAKLKSIRASARNGFPTADMDQMLAEISRGYGELP